MSHDPDYIHLPSMPLPPGLPPDDDFPCCAPTGPKFGYYSDEPMLTTSEVKVLTETAGEAGRRIGWKAAGEEIAAKLDELANMHQAYAVAHRKLSVPETQDSETYRRAASVFQSKAFGLSVAKHLALDIASQPPQATSDATSGVPVHPEVSEAARSPQEPGEGS